MGQAEYWTGYLTSFDYRGHEATAASAAMATAGRQRAARAGGGWVECGRRRRSDGRRLLKMGCQGWRTCWNKARSDGESGSGSAMRWLTRGGFGPDAKGCGMRVDTSLEGAHDWQHWARRCLARSHRWGSVSLELQKCPPR